MIDTENGRTLYQITGDIKDANTLLVNRAELREVLPLMRKLRIMLANYKRFKKFRLNM